MGGAASTKKPDPYNGPVQVPEFTAKETAILRSTWDKLSKHTDKISVDIFLHIFKTRPDVKSFFPFGNAVGEALLNHPYFKGHAMRFINAVKMAIDNLDAWEVILIPNLLTLGQRHTNIPGFTHDIFNLFYTSMDAVWSKHLGRTYNRQTKTAWCKLFRFLVNKVGEGYFEGLEIKKKQAENEQIKAGDTQLINGTNGDVPVTDQQSLDVNDTDKTC